ncbi:MAG: ribonuclease HII [bacterium]|nr:ribonuclease HII [bacterium]
MGSKAENNTCRDLAGFDAALAAQHSCLIAGVDEAGRGPWAGPVVAAAVILPLGCRLVGINDSKKLSPQKRRQALGLILSQAVAVGLGMVDPAGIDEVNILQATFKAMSFALCSLREKPGLIIVDGNKKIPRLPERFSVVPQRTIVKGDGLSLSIAAASIVAKCFRDSLMEGYELEYPGYGFVRHKGYGTKEHQKALTKMGPCPIHRRSYAPVRALLK